MEQCNFKNGEYTPCSNLANTLRGTNGNVLGLTLLHVANLVKGNDYYKGVVYKYGTSKKETVVIEFCPACGVNINPNENND